MEIKIEELNEFLKKQMITDSTHRTKIKNLVKKYKGRAVRVSEMRKLICDDLDYPEITFDRIYSYLLGLEK